MQKKNFQKPEIFQARSLTLAARLDNKLLNIPQHSVLHEDITLLGRGMLCTDVKSFIASELARKDIRGHFVTQYDGTTVNLQPCRV